MHSRSVLCSALFVMICLSSPALCQEDEKPEPKTHEVKTGPFKLEITLDGVFEAQDTHEIILRPEVWSTLKVEEVVPEGTKVKRGDTILKLDTQKIDEEIRDQEFALKLSDLSLQQAKVELETLEKSVPLDLEAARRSAHIAEEELQYFLEVTENQRKEAAAESLKSSEYSLEYDQEELDQLEQMYKADDLTEQTEEIILKRAQRSVERSEYFLRQAKERFDRTMEITLPREKQQVQETAERAGISLKKAEATLPASLVKQRIEVAKSEQSHTRLSEKLDLLKEDRKMLTVRAPADGQVFYGESDRGKWTTAATVRKQLRPGSSVTANSVVLTVVVDAPGVVRVDVPEKDFRYFKKGVPAVVVPTAFPDTRLSGECAGLAPAAVKDGVFDGRVNYESGKDDPTPTVGMTCKVTITPYENEEAVTVPESAVFGSGDDRHVFLKDGDKSTKQTVETGETSDGKSEITAGLSEGDVILLEKP